MAATALASSPLYGGMPLQILQARDGQRGRRFQPATVALMEAIVDEVKRHEIAITARHLFYRLTGATDYRPAAIPKTETAYHRVLDALLRLRRSGDVPWSAITDGTRMKTRWVGYGSLAAALDTWQSTYRRDIWRTSWATCEVWSESRGLMATINEVAGEYGTTTLGVGGFNSGSVGWETAQDVKRSADRGQAFYIFFFGDWDPSGRAIGDTAERDIRYHLSDDEQDLFEFQRVALTAELVEHHSLPTRPVKLNKDGSIRGRHARSWEGGVVELDALDPVVLQGLVRDAIESLIDDDQLAATKLAEASERSIISNMIATMGGAR